MDLYFILSLAAAFVALVVTGFSLFAAYMLFLGKRASFRAALQRWTVFDYIILSVFLIGSLFLLADLAGVLRDRDAYPFHHYGYLLSGFVYNTLAGIFLFIRLGLTLRLLGAEEGKDESSPVSNGTVVSANHNHHKPHETEAAEERI